MEWEGKDKGRKGKERGPLRYFVRDLRAPGYAIGWIPNGVPFSMLLKAYMSPTVTYV